MKLWKLNFFLSILSLISLVKNSEFLYDSDNDIVYFNNKKYVQLERIIYNKPIPTLRLSEEEGVHYLGLQDGASFYYYIISIICIQLDLFSYHSFCWTNVWFNSWIFIYR